MHCHRRDSLVQSKYLLQGLGLQLLQQSPMARHWIHMEHQQQQLPFSIPSQMDIVRSMSK